MPSLFLPADADTWLGGMYQLAVELGSRSDTRLQSAYEAIFHLPAWEGPYTHETHLPCHPAHIRPDWPGFRGLATLPDGQRLPCELGCVREGETPSPGPDWLIVSLPMGALTALYPDVGAYPFSRHIVPPTTSPPDWQANVEAFLRDTGIALYNRVPYRLGLIGFEISGETYASHVAQENGPPAKRWFGYLWPDDYGSLRYFAPNHYAPLFTIAN